MLTRAQLLENDKQAGGSAIHPSITPDNWCSNACWPEPEVGSPLSSSPLLVKYQVGSSHLHRKLLIMYTSYSTAVLPHQHLGGAYVSAYVCFSIHRCMFVALRGRRRAGSRDFQSNAPLGCNSAAKDTILLTMAHIEVQFSMCECMCVREIEEQRERGREMSMTIILEM